MQKKIRKRFGASLRGVDAPDLGDLQKESYERLLQMKVSAKKRADMGLERILRSMFPISDFSQKIKLEYLWYNLEKSKYSVEECCHRGLTYSAAIMVRLRLTFWDIDDKTGERALRKVKEQDVYIGEVPLMTDCGTFVINGIERVVISQVHVSPGVFFTHDGGRTYASEKLLYSVRVIPYRGSWMDIELDHRDLMYVRVDRRRKFLATTFLMALPSKKYDGVQDLGQVEDFEGMSREEILETFYDQLTYVRRDGQWFYSLNPESWLRRVFQHAIRDKEGNVLVQKGSKILQRTIKALQEYGDEFLAHPEEDICGVYTAKELCIDEEFKLMPGDEITPETLEALQKSGVDELTIILRRDARDGWYVRDTLQEDRSFSRQDALCSIYSSLRPGEPPTLEGADQFFKGLFFDPAHYDLSDVGRVKINERLGFDESEGAFVLEKRDVIRSMQILLRLRDGEGEVDDIDNLSNRRVRCVGELLENQYRASLLSMDRSVRERMGTLKSDVMPHDLINAKLVSSSVPEFFTASQLSQFMDQINPLAEVTHKRRLSALGPGGLSRERATFEVRDVHPTHYGRICPIETPEGPNIGLINSLATYGRVNKYGFIETPYFVVEEGVVKNEMRYLTAFGEYSHTIAQAGTPMDKDGRILADFVSCRRATDYVIVPVKEVTLIDISVLQPVSVAASLIPFLENDDANRALMGSNMQRQAIPLLCAHAPIVGTGIESRVVKGSGVVILAKRAGVVDYVSATRIVVRAADANDDYGIDIYDLAKYTRSNQSTCINQVPIVKVGMRVSAGDVLADGHATEQGELALGDNLLIGLLSWKGYNFEDSIMVSEGILHRDVFTSIHIEEFDVMTRDMKIGVEEITRDIPHVSNHALRHLDETGIVHVGAFVESGDVLVGKVTPKGESIMTPEDKLLQAVFGEKAENVRDTSLRVPSGISGTVVDVRLFSRRGVEKDEKALLIESVEVQRLQKDMDVARESLQASYRYHMRSILDGQEVSKLPKALQKNMNVGDKLGAKELESMSFMHMKSIGVVDKSAAEKLKKAGRAYEDHVQRIERFFQEKIDKICVGDDLPPGVTKMVKVFVAIKRKLQIGDKLAGRHGNKGVVSKITPIEDMPYLKDGRPLDMVLNPLGIPSRMNVGQVLEAHLGWAAVGLGKKIDKMVREARASAERAGLVRDFVKDLYGDEQYQESFSEMSDEELLTYFQNRQGALPVAVPVFTRLGADRIEELLKKADLDPSGQVVLYDGQTGDPFDRPCTVGYMYMLKLHHLVDEKIHARSVGPYSLVTQQPLGGKAQFGGQRFGEMEVWALEAYGAAYTLREILTTKSDDVAGRLQAYEAIVRGSYDFETGLPESFKVLVKEVRALGINIQLDAKRDR